jgi:hypothetical protein
MFAAKNFLHSILITSSMYFSEAYIKKMIQWAEQQCSKEQNVTANKQQHVTSNDEQHVTANDEQHMTDIKEQHMTANDEQLRKVLGDLIYLQALTSLMFTVKNLLHSISITSSMYFSEAYINPLTLDVLTSMLSV